jgi:integrase
MIRSTPLESALAEYLLQHRLQPCSAYQLGHTVALFAAWLQRQATVADLEDGIVSQWLCGLEADHCQRTVAGHRGNLLCLWRIAADQGVVDPPYRVRRVPRPPPHPVAWTLEELRQLLETCSRQSGTFRDGRARSLYLTTLIRVAYETGLRRSDLWRIEKSQIRPDGTLVLRQHKTAWPHAPRVRLETLTGLAELTGDRPLRCPFGSTGAWYRYWQRLVAEAKIRPGCLQQLRRTGASHLAIDHPEAVQRYLGHRSESMQRHYVDWSIGSPVPWWPPEV